MCAATLRRVRVLVNRRSGLRWSFESVRKAFDRHWEGHDVDLAYQFCQSAPDGMAKARRAVEEGVQALIVVGGDGTVNTAGAALLGTDVALGVIPVGSGNGFARHFGIPLSPEQAVKALARATVLRIDVGAANNFPFLVTCSMAWDAAIVRSFQKSPVRGILPYVLAGVYEFLEYTPQRIEVELDNGERLEVPDPLLFTVANLTQYGGGAVIAPQADAADGMLELVTARSQDIPHILANIGLLIKRPLGDLPRLVMRRFRRMTVRRPAPAPIQIDGELIDATAEVEVKVLPRALSVLVPPAGGTAAAGSFGGSVRLE
jgi:YegS/Rv2252/BmrU family lipid kinase